MAAWTEAEGAIVRQLVKEGLSVPEIAERLPGRTRSSVDDFCRRKMLAPKKWQQVVKRNAPVPMSRYPDYSGMSFTALVFGDPPRGRSALDQRQQTGGHHG